MEYRKFKDEESLCTFVDKSLIAVVSIIHRDDSYILFYRYDIFKNIR